MSNPDERVAAAEQASTIDDEARVITRFGRLEDQYVRKAYLEERCRGCHKIDDLKHDESTLAINRLVVAMEKLDERLGTYVPPVVHWVGELKTGALGFTSAICVALIIYLATH